MPLLVKESSSLSERGLVLRDRIADTVLGIRDILSIKGGVTEL